MEFIALSSGSSGNCFYVEHENKAVVIDVGISAKQVFDRLIEVGKSPESIQAILITHEHTDHIKGADVLARKLNIPIIATQKTFESTPICQDSSLLKVINNQQTFSLANFKIHSFPKHHKAADPVSFIVENGKKIAIITDAGHICPFITQAIEDSDVICLESNHDISLLDSGPYPAFLKAWIKSDIGHLSNRQAALAVLEFAPKKLQTLILAHLSETNNTPKHALNTSISLLKERIDLKPKIIVSQRDKPSPIVSVL